MTRGGKIFCMFYAMAGIPLCLVMFQSIGERLNTVIAICLHRLKEQWRDENVHSNLIWITFTIGVAIIAMGAYVFHRHEQWGYFDSIYYCFITLTTIGFGDYVAMQKDGTLQSSPVYVGFSIIFILFGLTVVSAAMNLLVLRFLTMNTIDERRDEEQARLMAQGLMRVEGDITSLDQCNCYQIPQNWYFILNIKFKFL